jgi:hypothetical protein
MSEIKLQSDIVREFSRLYPQKRGQLFHVSNERNNKIQAFQARAIGIFTGVCDFLFMEGFGMAGIELIGIEIKEPGSYHKREHIEQQVKWAKTLVNCGGYWRLCRSVEEAISCTEFNLKGLTIQDVEKMLSEQKTKSIKF